MIRIFFLILAFSFSTTAYPQDGIQTGAEIWNWGVDKDYHNVIVKVMGKVNNSYWHGTGAVVHVYAKPNDAEHDYALVLSANHVLPDGHCEILYPNGAKFITCPPVLNDKENDLVLIKTLCPKGFKPIKISDKEAVPNEKVEICGYGGPMIDKHLMRCFIGETTITSSKERFVGAAYLLRGDSGGPIMRDGEIVGVISSGLTGASATVRHIKSDWERLVVYPTMGSGQAPIKKLLEDYLTANPQAR